MSRPLPKEDFRASRIVLEPSDFAIGSEQPDPKPNDPISEKAWNHLVMLPDDVAVRTSAEFGTVLAEVSELQSELINVSLAAQEIIEKAGLKIKESPIAYALLVTADEMSASLYNSLTGYYRVAFSAQRNVVENFAVASHLEISKDVPRFRSWLAGEGFGFGWAADNLPANKSVRELELHLDARVADDLFRQKTGSDPGGFARRLFGRLSKYTHGAPGFTDGDMWESNGPVFAPNVFKNWHTAFLQTYAFGLIACRLAMPNLNILGNWSKKSVGQLFSQAVGRLDAQDEGAALFQNLPANFW